MQIALNSEQTKGLANFFFDIAKGFILGGIGSAFISPEAKMLVSIISIAGSFICVIFALSLLEEVT